jgi:protein-S-isoprenylcysteine O-methyltransferase Ste14
LPSRLRVPLGYLVGALVLACAHPSRLSVLSGLALALPGEGVRLWASGHIDKTHALATGGPYAYTRNPLYVGSLVLAIGTGVASASLWAVLAVLAYLLGFFPSVIREEALFLRQRFPEEYETWAQSVPLFIPRLTPGGPRTSRFSWSRVRKNREWRAALALPGMVCAFCLRRFLGS